LATYRKISFKVIDDVNSDEFFDEIVVLGIKFRKENKVFSLNNSMKVSIFLYAKNIKLIKYFLKVYNKRLLLDNNGDLNIYDKIKNEYPENDLEELFRKISIKNCMLYYFSTLRSNDYTSTIKCSVFLNSEIYFGFFNEKHKLYILNRNKKEIVQTEAKNIKPNQELVFLSMEFKTGDFIENIVDNLLENKEFERKYKKKIENSKLWSSELEKIKNREGWTYKEISDIFMENGISINFNTVRNWINNEYLIGAQDKSVFEVIANLSENEYYKKNWEAVFNSCKEVRSMHIKIRHELAQEIISSSVGSNDFDNKLLSYLHVEKNKLIKTCQITSVSRKVVQLSYSDANTMKVKGG
ncbi:DrmE family protein, partial [Clostridiaceae bacterium HSG29]|nr:DrmE family protein [Clostridiaceae bacterium HSG29]